MKDTPRLDILLYAHDGRGLGHASRSIAIGMALRRLFPSLKVLFLSGCKLSQELIGSAPLDWLKLPSYETTVFQGKSRGRQGNSNFEDDELGKLRGEQIKQVITTYRPKLVLADHSPQGKHKELRPALDHSFINRDTRWILGMRGVIGQVGQVSSDLAAAVFKKHYHSLLWYGDKRVLGDNQLIEISKQFNTEPYECGYVSRIREAAQATTSMMESLITGTVSIPWFGEKTSLFLDSLYTTLKNRDSHERWDLYLDPVHSESDLFFSKFSSIPKCRVARPSQNYIHSLQSSRCAIIYGGYNSLMDVLSVDLPAIVIERDMKDNEQQSHLEKLIQADSPLKIFQENGSPENLAEILSHIIQPSFQHTQKVNLTGAETAARKLHSLL